MELPLTLRGMKWGHLLGMARPLGAVASPLLYIEWWYFSLTCSFTCPLVPLPAVPPKKTWLRRSPAEIFYPPPQPPRRSVVGLPGGSSTSAAPLERGNGGRRQAVRVTEYGNAAHCSVRLRGLEIGK